MWIFTTDGFISCVRQGDRVAIRARERGVLEALLDRHPLLMGYDAEQPIVVSTDTDYRYRTFATVENFEVLMGALAREVDYPNFKNAVADKQGESLYEKALHKVWTIMGRTQPGGPYGWGGMEFPPVPKGEPRAAPRRERWTAR